MSVLRLERPAFAYRFDLLLEFVRRIACPARMIVEGGKLWRFIGGELLSFEEEGGRIVIHRRASDGEPDEEIVSRAAHCLGWERDLSDFYAYAQSDPQLEAIVAPLVGLPILCAETVYEALITLIIEQHISWKNALRAQRTLMRLFCDGVYVGGHRVYDFPAPAQLAGATPEQLKALKITDRRSRLIIDIAEAVAQGKLNLQSLPELPTAEAYAELLRIKGVGPWTAGNVIGRALGQHLYVTRGDVALQAAVNHYFCGGRGVKSAEQTEATLGEYGGFAGLAGHFVLLRWVFDRYPARGTAQTESSS